MKAENGICSQQVTKIKGISIAFFGVIFEPRLKEITWFIPLLLSPG